MCLNLKFQASAEQEPNGRSRRFKLPWEGVPRHRNLEFVERVRVPLVILRAVEGLLFSKIDVILIVSRELVDYLRMGTAIGPRSR
jgi:hypothetical protein